MPFSIAMVSLGNRKHAELRFENRACNHIVTISSCNFGQRTTLVVPSLCPAAGAERSVGQKELQHVSGHPHIPNSTPGVPYLAAGRKVLALGGDALVVVDVVLPAVLGLVLVREAGIEA